MKRIVLLLTGFIIPGLVWANPPAAIEILDRIDQNMTGDHMISTSSLVIHSLRGSRTIKARSWIQGRDRSFTEYLAPAREKGTKMLKVENNLWTYYPRADRVVKIAGHMLRQSMMGSDLSFEDMMERPQLKEVYQATVEGEEIFMERSCWVLHLQAKTSDIAYQVRKIWVDQERFIALKEELYTKRGKLLKTTEIREVFRAKERWYPRKMWFKDAFKTGKGTEILIHDIAFDVEIPDSQFSKRALRR